MKSISQGEVTITWPTARTELTVPHDLAGWDIARCVGTVQQEELIRACTDPKALRVAGFLTTCPTLRHRLKKRHRELCGRIRR